ncbi:thiamine biosynthesis protein ThiS [Thermococcus chitonophagus]|uniref:Thiamine biosynthesis protein ThiS n=1 Tax=Thermococcus chitonophagus TaxID=54262 RepID=A0A160VTQ2_9EURY|nr:MoaD/ThiS family protein [Thermococcus chitonophagus]ASJ17496.1 thiamine biosynthesis protein ThiS [Thermococcus chitonophagus]CUX78149.1 hypothetical protein CHITON_1370 [Thermococcus chitonophagus]
MRVTVILYGNHALKYGPKIEIKVREGERVGEVLRELKIAPEDYHLLINERKVDENYQLKDGDTVKVLPIVYGGNSITDLTASFL